MVQDFSLFSNKKFVITGASSDVGLKFIEALGQNYEGEDGPLLICHYHSSCDKLMKLAENYPKLKIHLFRANLADNADVDNFITGISNRMEAPDYFIHLPAKKFDYMRYKDMDMELVRQEMEIQTYSFLRLTQPFLPKMKKIDGSRIVVMLTSYVTEELPPQFMVNYVVAKYALLGAMKAVASEFGGKKLLCNGISPTMMETKFLQNIDPRIVEMSKSSSPNGELLKPDQVVPYIYELMAADCDKNGQNIIIGQ